MTEFLLPFVIISLAGWTISSLLVNEDGPYAIFTRLREWVGVQQSAYLNPEVSADWLTIVQVAQRKEIAPGDDGSYAIPARIGVNPDHRFLEEVAWALTCVWCTSMWVLFALYAIQWIFYLAENPLGFSWLLSPLAARTVVIWIHKVID